MHQVTTIGLFLTLLVDPSSSIACDHGGKCPSGGGFRPGPPPIACNIPNNQYQSGIFQLDSEEHILTVWTLNKKPIVRLVAMNDSTNLTDDTEYLAAPFRVPRPHPPTNGTATGCDFKPAHVTGQQKETCIKPRKSICRDTTISFRWGLEAKKSVPASFAGQLQLELVNGALSGTVAVVTDRYSSALLELTLSPVFQPE